MPQPLHVRACLLPPPRQFTRPALVPAVWVSHRCWQPCRHLTSLKSCYVSGTVCVLECKPKADPIAPLHMAHAATAPPAAVFPPLALPAVCAHHGNGCAAAAQRGSGGQSWHHPCFGEWGARRRTHPPRSAPHRSPLAHGRSVDFSTTLTCRSLSQSATCLRFGRRCSAF